MRRHHREYLNLVLRRPGMYGPIETAEHLVLEMASAAEGRHDQWRAEYDALRDSDEFASTGVKGAYGTSMLPKGSLRGAVTSRYAVIAHHLGLLDLDRALSADDYRTLLDSVPAWVAEDRTHADVVEAFGEPSMRIGGSSPRWAKTLLYGGADDPICFHIDEDERSSLLAVRLPGSEFVFTPAGRRRRPTADRQSPARATVWVFQSGRFPAGVFASRQDGLDWAAEHRVGGLLAEYPIGGAYDVAVAEGRFTPRRDHHGTPGHVAGFSPGLDHVHLVDGFPDA